MPKIKTDLGTRNYRVVSQKEWLGARKRLLASEKKMSKMRDRLAAQRQKLPWVKMTKHYEFDTREGRKSLAELFRGKSQLIVYHFMFGPGWKEGCAHCSFWADHYDGVGVHLAQRDTTLVVVSQAPLREIAAFKKRMGWNFRWVSSNKTSFNEDFGVAFTKEQLASGNAVYNYAKGGIDCDQREGASVFFKDDKGVIYHTYSTYARGIDLLNTTYNFLDLTPKGRDEPGEFVQAWVRFHDRYPYAKPPGKHWSKSHGPS